MDEQEQGGRSMKARAALGLAAAAAAAYGVYLWGGPGGRRQPVTELGYALKLRLHYVPWRNLHYAYYSRAGSGRPLVFLHSVNAIASAHEVKPLVERFQADSGRPLYALEWLGFGHSDRPEISYTPELLEEQLEHFLSRIVKHRGGADVVAVSLGANYGAELARRRPDLLRSLVAIEPAGLGQDPPEIGGAWGRLLFTLPGVQRAFYDRLTTPDALEKFARENLFTDAFGVPEEYLDYGVRTSRVEGASRPLDDFLSGRLTPDDAADAFLHMRSPLLVVHGTASSRRMETYTTLPELAARPDTEVHGLPTGALPHWERPDEVVDRIERFHDRIESSVGSAR